MAVTNYYAVDGELLGEKTAGSSRLDYLTDGLGSVTATLDQSAQVVNTYRYKPYGTQLAKTGTGADPAYTWVGTQGYRQTGRKFSDIYVRARHYSASTARWITKVRLEEQLDGEHSYGYGMNNPVTYVDPSGLTPSGTTHGTSTRMKCSPLGKPVPLPSKSDPAYNCYLDVCNEYNYWDAHISNLRNNLCTGYMRCSSTIQCLPDCRKGDMFIEDCDKPVNAPGGSGRMHQFPYPISTQGFCCQECDVRVCCSIDMPNRVRLDNWLASAFAACKQRNKPMPKFSLDLPDCAPDYPWGPSTLFPEPKRKRIRR